MAKMTAEKNANVKDWYISNFPDDKKGLKALLRFLDEDIYQSPISGNRFQTNSKRKIAAQA